MAGHSKWANIKHKKVGQDAKRGKLFTKLIREISVAARNGIPDEATNPRLRAAIDKALTANMSRDTINRAIKRAAGGEEGHDLEECRYEGYAPFGIAILLDCVTNNKNRTVSEIRHAFTKAGGNLGTDGSVAYLFKKVGQIILAPTEPKVMEFAIDLGAEDVNTESDGSIEILVAPTEFSKIKAGLEQANFIPAFAEITMRAETPIELDPESSAKIMKLIEILEDLDDVQTVYTNANFSDS